MDKLTNKQSAVFDYQSRYAGVPFYYDTVKKRETPGLTYQINFENDYFIHKVKADDTLDKLALVYYNNPTFWWLIAYFNKINDPFIDLKKTYKTLKIPAVTNNTFEV